MEPLMGLQAWCARILIQGEEDSFYLFFGHALDGEADPAAFFVHVEDHYLDDVAHLQGLAGVVQAAG